MVAKINNFRKGVKLHKTWVCKKELKGVQLNTVFYVPAMQCTIQSDKLSYKLEICRYQGRYAQRSYIDFDIDLGIHKVKR